MSRMHVDVYSIMSLKKVKKKKKKQWLIVIPFLRGCVDPFTRRLNKHHYC